MQFFNSSVEWSCVFFPQISQVFSPFGDGVVGEGVSCGSLNQDVRIFYLLYILQHNMISFQCYQMIVTYYSIYSHMNYIQYLMDTFVLMYHSDMLHKSMRSIIPIIIFCQPCPFWSLHICCHIFNYINIC